METDRLETLANFLETQVPENRFNMASWATGNLNECGTAGCAAGWACMIPEFQQLGLKLTDSQCGFLRPEYNGYVDFAALSDFFDLCKINTAYIFEYGEFEQDNTIAATITRIRIIKEEQEDEC